MANRQLEEAKERAEISNIIVLSMFLVALSFKIATIIIDYPFRSLLVSLLATTMALIFAILIWCAINIVDYLILKYKFGEKKNE